MFDSWLLHTFIAILLYCPIGALGVLLCRELGVTAGQLDLTSLSLLSIAGWSLLQVGVANWVTAVALLK